MRLGVLASTDSWYLRDLARAAGSAHEIVPLTFSQLSGALVGTDLRIYCGQEDLSHLDAVLVRTMPPGSLEQVVLRMDLLGRYEAAGGVVINPPRAVETAVDKFLTSAKLLAAGLATPRTIVCQTADDALTAFAQLGGDVVVKPLFGSEGRGITRVSDPDLALRCFKMLTQLGAVLYLQEFLPHEGYDLRLLVIGSDVFGMRRSNSEDWRTNVSRGATAERFRPDEALTALARQAAETIGAPVAGVDLLPARNGSLYVIEVNAVPGWQALARTHNIDIAARMLAFVEERVREAMRA